MEHTHTVGRFTILQIQRFPIMPDIPYSPCFPYTLLARYRVTPQLACTTGRAPAGFMLKTPPQGPALICYDHQCRTKLSRNERATNSGMTHMLLPAARTFMTGEIAWALQFQGKPKWMPTVIDNQLGPLIFTVRLSDGRLWKRHQDHLRERRPDETDSVGAEQQRPEVLLPPPPLPPLTSTDMERDVSCPLKTSDSAPARVRESPVANRMPPLETVVPRIVASPVRRSTRVAKAPVKLNL